MKHAISDEDFTIHILANLPEEYESDVESLDNDLDNEDDPLTLDCILVELDTKNKKICKKNNYDPENEDKKKGRMVWHLKQAEMVYLKEDATYMEIGDTKAISVHSETTHILRTDKICKICKICKIYKIQRIL